MQVDTCCIVYVNQGGSEAKLTHPDVDNVGMARFEEAADLSE